mmetsp:Transcript_69655/g.215348  ORF Transcript_69655/g.215348 Transcript_69655/m.215348 type:complete len:260 (-) Transcript_69655:195-974(-)
MATSSLRLPLVLGMLRAPTAWALLNGSTVLAEGGTCRKDTGKHCNVLSCPASYGQTVCEGGFMSHFCRCAEGYCLTVAGVCEKASEIASCQTDTGGLCRVLACDPSRGNTTCTGGRCLCAAGSCATEGGLCEASGPDAGGHCATFTGSTCTVTGMCLNPMNVQCVKASGVMVKEGACMCKPGTCLFKGVCLSPAMIQFILNYLRLTLGFLAFGFFFWCFCVPVLGSGYIACNAAAWVMKLCHREKAATGKQEPLLDNSS